MTYPEMEPHYTTHIRRPAQEGFCPYGVCVAAVVTLTAVFGAALCKKFLPMHAPVVSAQAKAPVPKTR
jgi:hypothetical protein